VQERVAEALQNTVDRQTLDAEFEARIAAAVQQGAGGSVELSQMEADMASLRRWVQLQVAESTRNAVDKRTLDQELETRVSAAVERMAAERPSGAVSDPARLESEFELMKQWVQLQMNQALAANRQSLLDELASQATAAPGLGGGPVGVTPDIEARINEVRWALEDRIEQLQGTPLTAGGGPEAPDGRIEELRSALEKRIGELELSLAAGGGAPDGGAKLEGLRDLVKQEVAAAMAVTTDEINAAIEKYYRPAR
jgi:citrate lyase gamma subunit